jgi:hypothetical protein
MTEPAKKMAPESSNEDESVSIPKPEAKDWSQFKSTRSKASVKALPTALTIKKISDARDFVRLHENDAPPEEGGYWSEELCFVLVPIKGQKEGKLHIIREDLAEKCLPRAQILRFRLALACDPDGRRFLCKVPSQNLDNKWNKSNLEACQHAKTKWTKATSKDDGSEEYEISFPRDASAFADPEWPEQGFYELMGPTFEGGLSIMSEDHPSLLRLIGKKQSSS